MGTRRLTDERVHATGMSVVRRCIRRFDALVGHALALLGWPRASRSCEFVEGIENSHWLTRRAHASGIDPRIEWSGAPFSRTQVPIHRGGWPPRWMRSRMSRMGASPQWGGWPPHWMRSRMSRMGASPQWGGWPPHWMRSRMSRMGASPQWGGWPPHWIHSRVSGMGPSPQGEGGLPTGYARE